MKLLSNKKLLWLTAGISLLGVFVASIATAAWFQLDSQPLQGTITSSSPNLTIDNANVTGYKIQPSLGTDGFPDYLSNTVSEKKGGTYDTMNDNQDDADTVFDVPESGLGYYLVKKNSSDTYKYKYNGVSYSWKFKEFDSSGVKYFRIDANSIGTINSSTTFIVRKYSYNSEEFKTVNVKVDVSKDTGNFTIDSTTYEITPSSEGSYNIWFNSSTKKVSFETTESASSFNLASKSLHNRPTRASGATPEDNTVYLLYDGSNLWNSGARMFLEVKTGTNPGYWYEFTDSGYKYNDVAIYKATASGTITTYDILRRNSSNTDPTWNWSNVLTFSTSNNYHTYSSYSGSVINFNRSAFSSVIYDGWVIVGYSGTSGSSFYGKSWDSSGAIRLDEDASNLGKVVVDLKAGDKFKMAYMKGGSVTTEEYNYYANNTSGDTRMEVYGGSVSTYFETDSDKNCKVKTGKNIHCTIYFTNAKKINVNITSSVIVRAVKFSFSGSYEEIASTNAATYETTLGATVNVSTINGLSMTIPSNYTRETGNYLYSNSDCAVGNRISTSFTASSNPHYVYIKVQENAITIYLQAFYVNNSGDSSGTIDASQPLRKLTLNTQYGANSTVTASGLATLWRASYSDALSYNSINYTYSRIDNSTHNAAFSDGKVANGTTLYVRYVRNRHTITLTPSFFLHSDDGGDELDLTLSYVKYTNGTSVTTQTETILDGNAFSTSKTFNPCQFQDHTNGIWYVFAREGSTWYSDPECKTSYSGTPTSNIPLYAKMVAYPLTTFYIDADTPGWDNCYLHMWGTLSGLSSEMNSSLTAKSVTTDSGNKLFKISIPTTNITGFLIHNGVTSGDSNKTSDIAISGLTGSSSKYLYIGTGSPHSASFVEYKSTSATGVWVQKYSGGAWNNVVNGQLLHGDGVGNDYILESGLQLTNNDVIRVYNSGNGTVYGYSKYIDGNKAKHTYVTGNTVGGESSNSSIKITRLGAANTTARFNFYITHSGYISIAMVPDYGNGFYIMEYNSTDKTENYIQAIKMDSSDYTASYDGYYCSNVSTKIFIRSYLNAVDNICTSLTVTSSTYATMNTSSGDDLYCITFKATGHYNIKVTNQIVDISAYNVNDFFSLNRLDSTQLNGKSDLAKQQEIWRQKTAIVMEIPFTSNNPFNAVVKLRTECSASFIGVRFAVYSSQQVDPNPYALLHGGTNSYYTTSYLTAANTTNQIDDTNNLVISANSASTYYAYILIDYRYTVTASNLTSANPELTFYLQIVQQ